MGYSVGPAYRKYWLRKVAESTSISRDALSAIYIDIAEYECDLMRELTLAAQESDVRVAQYDDHYRALNRVIGSYLLLLVSAISQK